VCERRLSAEQSWSSGPHVAKIGAGWGMSFASFRRFWAVAAGRNSSLAPFGPRRRNRPSLRMGFILTIPGERMKQGRTHRVPLSPQAWAILEAQRALGISGDHVFPNPFHTYASVARSYSTTSLCLPLWRNSDAVRPGLPESWPLAALAR
jgi:hypothetical protein